MAVTFTNKAAQEMRERVEQLLDIDCRAMWVSTFHALCARLLRREAHNIGLSRDFTIYDSADQQSVIKQLLQGVSPRRRDVSAADGAEPHQRRQEPDGRARELRQHLERPRQARSASCTRATSRR